MRVIYNILPNIKKVLIMLLLVVFLTACGDSDNTSPGEICPNEEASMKGGCIDAKDVICVGCRVFTIIFNAVSTNVMRLHGQLTSGALSLMMICFSIWLAVRLLKFVTSLSDASISQFWNDVLKQGFLCIFCGFLASSPEMLIYAVNTFVYPIYVAFLKLGIAIMELSVTDGNGVSATFMVYGESITVGKSSFVCVFDKSGLITKNGFPEEFHNAMLCMIIVIKEYLTIGGEIAVELMDQSKSAMGWITGAAIWLCFFVVKFGIVFYLVDNVFQMGIIILLLPIFILAYPFNSTRKWLTSCFTNLLASAGFLMCFSIVISMTLKAMISLIVNNQAVFSPGNAQVDASNIGLGCLCLLLVGFLVYGSVGVAEQITSKLIDADMGKNFQKNMTEALKSLAGHAVKGVGAVLTLGAMLPASVGGGIFLRLKDGFESLIKR